MRRNKITEYMASRKKRILTTLIAFVAMMTFIGIIAAQPGMFSDFTGPGHTGCHTGTTADATGTLSWNSSSGTTVNTDEVFIIQVSITGWTTQTGDDIEVGFPDGSPGLGDNAQFTFNVSQYNLVLDGSGNAGPVYFGVTAPSTANSYTLELYALQDVGGGSAQLYYLTASIALTVQTATDTQAPSVTITAPSSGSVAGNVTITATVTDNVGVNSVWAEVDDGGAYNQTVSMSNAGGDTYQGTWDSTGGTGDGSYTITVKADDVASNVGSDNVGVTVDNTGPSITNLWESADPVELGATETIQADVSDATGVSSVQIEIAGANNTMTNLGNGSYSYNSWTPSTVGIKSYTVYATDTLSNVASTSGDINVQDTTNPTIENVSESADPLELGATETIQVDVSDFSGVLSVVIEIGGSNFTMGGIGGNTYEYNNWTPLSVGPKAYTIYATDNQTNTGSLPGSILVEDNTNPVLENPYESDDPLVLGNTETIEIDVTDLSAISSIQIEIASTNYSMTDLGNNTYRYNLWTPTSIGVKPYTIYATDNEGNIGTYSSDITVIDAGAPTIENITESADPLELGATENITADVYDASGLSSVVIEIGGSNFTMTSSSGNTYYYDSWTPTSVGLKIYTIYATDSSSNVASISGNITVEDTTVPSLGAPGESADPLELGATETIQIVTTDQSTITSVQIEIGGTNYSMSFIAVNTYEYDAWTPITIGLKSYTIYSTDNEGNTGSTTSNITVVDTTNPTLENLTESASTLELGSQETIGIDAWDLGGINNVLIEIGGNNYSMSGVGGNTYQYNWTPISVGINAYVIYAIDPSSNVQSLSDDILVVDPTNPTVNNPWESTDPLELGATETIQVDVSDVSAITSVDIEIGGSNISMTNLGNGSYSYSLWVPSSVGLNSYTVYATDSEGNIGSLSGDITVEDTTDPTVDNPWESADPLELGATETIQVDVSDLSSITTVEIEIAGSNISMTNLGNGSYSYNAWTPAGVGVKSYTVYATDNEGNVGSLSGDITVVDTTGPTVDNLWELADPLELGATETIQVDVSDLSTITTVEIEIAGSNMSMTDLGNGSYSYNLWTPVGVGVRFYTVYATDNESNIGSLSSSITVVDTTGPTVDNPWESADPLELGTTETIQVDVTDLSTITTVEIEIAGVNNTMTDLGNGSYSYNSWVPSTVGLNSYIVYATDNESNIGSLAGSINVEDTTNPTVDNPRESADPLELGAIETIQVDVTDLSAITTVEIEIASMNYSMTDLGNGSYSYNVWVPSSTGLKSYTVYATDNEGNVGTLSGDIIVEDTTDPTWDTLVESADPLPLGQNETIQINAYDSPGSGIASVILEYKSANHTMNFIGGDMWEWTLWQPSTAMTYSYVIYITDNSGNSVQTSGNIMVEASAGPTLENVTKTSPLELGDTAIIEIDAFDNDTVDEVWIMINSVNYTMTNIIGNTWQYNAWTPTSIGSKSFRIYANDSFGNENQFNDLISVVDTTEPDYSNYYENASTIELGESVLISIDVTDLGGISQVILEFLSSNNTMTDMGNDSWQYTLNPSSAGVAAFTIYMEDNSGNINTTSDSMNVQDTTDPTVNNPWESADPLELGATETIQVDVSDLSAITTVEIEIASTNYSMTNLGNGSYSYSTWVPSLVGSNSYTVYATDSEGNVGTLSGDITVEDTTDPTVNNPWESADPLELGTTETIQVDVSDVSAITSVDIEIGGSNISMTNLGNGSFSYNAWTPLGVGVKPYTVYATDNEGNIGSLSGNITVVDTTGPTVDNLWESADPLELGATETIQVDVTDLSPLSTVEIEIGGANNTMTNLGNGSYSYNAWIPNTIGLKAYTVYATDNESNVGTLGGTIDIQDTTGPIVENITESADPLELGATETIQVDVSDFSIITSVDIEIGGSNISMTNLGNGSYSYNLWTPGSVGIKSYTIYATDSEGNVGSLSGDITVEDTTAPALSGLSESASTIEIGLTETVDIDVTDLSTIDTVWLDIGGTNYTMTLLFGFTYRNNSWITDTLGLNAYTIYANDSEGNVNSLTDNITVIDTTDPTVQNIIESADPLPLGSTETIQVDASDLSGIVSVEIEFGGSNHSMTDLGNGSYVYNTWVPSTIGSKPYTIHATDNGGNVGMGSGSILVVDTGAPTVENLTESADPLELGAIETIQVDVYDSTGISTVEIEIGSTNYSMTDLGNGSYSYAWTPSSAGTIVYTIYATDTTSNVGTLSDDITVEDTTLPLVENITVSAGPIELGLTVIIDVDVWDLSGIDTVLLEHGGVNYTMTWVILNQYRNNTWVTTVTGVNAYTIHVNDTEGNVNSVSSDLTVQDTTDPILENLTESASTLELGDKETIRVDAWDLSGIASVLIEIAGINYSMTDLGNGTYENSTWMPSTVGLKTYMIYAEDNNGNIQILSDSINVVDTTNPTIENVTESADPLELGLGEMIAADAADLTGITSMQIEIGAANTSMADLGNGTYTYLWTPTSVGLTPYTIYATDGEGNVNSHWSNITVQDTTGPTIENVSESADPLFISLNETIQVDIWDLSSLDVLQIDINGSVNPLSLVSGNTYMYTWTPGGVGLYVYNITANDTEGNLNWLSGDITVIDSIPLFENITESGDPVELGSNITITVDITDILGISAVWIDINSSLVNLTNPVNDTWSVSWQPGSIGLYIYTIYAENNGNYSSSIGGNFTVQDTTGPAFVAINLNSNTINVGKVLVLSIEVFDVSGVQYVLVEINSISYNLTSNVSSLYVFNIWSSATTGDYQYIITTMDILNNSNSFTGYFKVVINNDGAGDGDADFDLQDFIDRLMDPTAIIYFAISLIAVIGGILIKTRRKVHGRDWDKR